MSTTRRLFSVDLDLIKLNRDLGKNKIENREWFSIIETFIKSFEQEKELVQLLCISKIGIPDGYESEFSQIFSKAVFKVSEDSKFEQVTPRVEICMVEYYNKLTTNKTDAVENKMRLVFEHDEIKYSLEFLSSSRFMLLQIEFQKSHDDHTDISISEIFKNFPSVKVLKEHQLTLEEAFYRWYFNPEYFEADKTSNDEFENSIDQFDKNIEPALSY